VSAINPVAGGRHLLLTFDDGGRSAQDAAGILERHGWRGHFFIVTSLVGQRGFLTAADIRDLRARGHVIGTHSHTHPDIFRAQSRARMVAEWRTSADYLEDLLGEPCLAGSVPGGDISTAALESAGEAGLRFLFTSEPWTKPWLIGGCWVFGRYGVKATTSPTAIADLAAFRGWGRARLARRLKVLASHGLGPVYRWYVRRTTRPWPAVTAPGA
jgi:peptidoglycan/xylan/chitin deacetylase (PgdA/CDA1 family)